MNKYTKKALLTSVLSLLLCVSMLIGTTFAWFTDSVTTGVNTIQSGKLDVELADENGAALDDILYFRNKDGSADILWEPGASFKLDEFQILNKGNLALKYQVVINGVADGDAELLEAIDFEVSITKDGNTSTVGTFAEWAASVADNEILPGESSGIVSVIGTMKEEAGNKYQDLKIEGVTITVLATQATEEVDMTDDQYDAGATYPEVKRQTVPANSTVPTPINLGDFGVDIPAGAPAGVYELQISNKNVKTDENGETTVSVDINLLKDGVKVQPDGNTVYTVTIDIGTGKRVFEVSHKGEPIDSFDYDSQTGIVTFETSSFSPFAIVFDTAREVTGLSGKGTKDEPYLINDYWDLCWFRDHVNTCAQDGSSQYKDKFIKLTADINLNNENWEPIGSTTKDHGSFYGNFDGDGHTISNLYVELGSGEGAAGFFAKVSGGGDGPRAVVQNLVFENVDVYSPDSYSGGIIGNAGGNSEVRNVTVKGDIYVAGYGYVGGIVGHGYPDMYNCHVIANEGSYVNCNYWCGGGMIGYAGEGGTYLEDCSVSGIRIWSNLGAGGAVVGLLQYGNTLKNVHASDVEVSSASDYVMGYIAGNGEESTYVNVSMKNVISTANGKAITSSDNVNITVK